MESKIAVEPINRYVMDVSNNKLELKPYSKKELAEIYSISVRCLNNWINKFKPEVGAICGRFYNVNQVRVIFGKLGLPGTIGEPQEEPKQKNNNPQKK
jgi:hypothetical protein